MSDIPYLFFRYSIEHDGQSISASDQWKLLEKNKAIEVAHRKINPSEIDKDTSIVSLNKLIFDCGNGNSLPIFYFRIARHIIEREYTEYDKSDDELKRKSTETDEYHHAQIIILPRNGLLAASDRYATDGIGALGAVSRFKSVIKAIHSHRLLYEPAATSQDLKKALTMWSIEEVSFGMRPFNQQFPT